MLILIRYKVNIKTKAKENRHARTVEIPGRKPNCMVKIGSEATVVYMVINMTVSTLSTTITSKISLRCVTGTYKFAQMRLFHNTRLPLSRKQRNSTTKTR